MEFDFDTIITGAGISVDRPSALPDGDQLARHAWLGLFPDPGAKELRRICEDALPARADDDNGLRLEYLLEILGVPIGLDPLINVYKILDGSEPNLNHQMIVGLPTHQHFTLNMDTLLEQAAELSTVASSPHSKTATADESADTQSRSLAAKRFVHLHGRWDAPEGIKTTISQYLGKLPTALHDEFVESVRDRNVLVMGYSGRDFDVFPELVANKPRRLVWLMYPGSSLVAEVAAELERLERAGCQVECPEATVADYLSDFVERTQPSPDRKEITGAHTGHDEPARSVVSGDLTGGDNQPNPRDTRGGELERALLAVPLSKRALGAARVLFELGAFEQLDELAALRPCTGADAALLRKVRARAQRRRGHNMRALGLLIRPPTNRDAAKVTLGNVNEVANLLTRVGAPGVGRTADRLLVNVASRRDNVAARRFELQATVRIGQDMSVRGRLHDATRLLGSVVDAPDVRDVIGLSGEVDATTWLLDAMKAQGRYSESLQLVSGMETIAPYTNLSQRAYAYWQIGSVWLLAGQIKAARASLETALTIAKRSADRQAQTWVVGTLSDAYRDDRDAGRAKLDEAVGSGVPAENLSNHYLARQYIYLQLAEQARVERDLDEARRQARRAAHVRPPGRIRPRRHSMNALAAGMIELLVRAEHSHDEPSAWTTQAERQLAQYERLGAHAAAMDVRLLLHKVAGRSMPVDIPEPVEGSLQFAWLHDDWHWRRPWHISA